MRDAQQGILPGAQVKLVRGDGQLLRFVLVPPAESDIDQGKLSTASPLGRALLGKAPGDEVTYQVQADPVTVTVLEVAPSSQPGRESALGHPG